MLNKVIRTLPPPIVKEQKLVFVPKNTSEKILYTPTEALHLAKIYAIAPFEESIDMVIRLNVDTKRGDQIVRGTCYMPAGLGIKSNLAVFTSEQYKADAYKAGADIAGEEAFELLKTQTISFDKVLATPEVTDVLKPYGRLLGSKGLMPNKKLGTIIDSENLTDAIRNAKLGSVTFRIEHNGAMIHAPIGRSSFTEEMLFDNFSAFVQKILELKPATAKGNYIRNSFVTSTHGPSWKLDPKELYALQ